MGDEIEVAVDLISNLPDVILQHILCFVIPTKVAISTSLLSRRWRHVWCEITSLSLDVDTLKTADSVNKTLTRYTAPKTKSFHLTINPIMDIPYIEIDRLIKFAMSHNVENLSLDFHRYYYERKLPSFFYSSSSFKQLNITLGSHSTIVPECNVSWTSLQKLSLTCRSLSDESMAKILTGCPILETLSLNFLGRRDCYHVYKPHDFFYSKSSFKQLNIMLSCPHTIVPECAVSWTSLQKLSLRYCRLSDESMAKILSGSPILESLTLFHCRQLIVLDLSKSLRLRTLEVINNDMGPGQIVAPHIQYLRLYDPRLSCTLVDDVASLTEAKLEISRVSLNTLTVLEMLDKLKNAEKLKLGRNFIKVLSEIPGVPFPMFKVKALTLDTEIYQYVIPGIERLLQNSPDLETLTVRGRTRFHMPVEIHDIVGVGES